MPKIITIIQSTACNDMCFNCCDRASHSVTEYLEGSLVKVVTASRSHSIIELMPDECILVELKSMIIDPDSTEKLVQVAM